MNEAIFDVTDGGDVNEQLLYKLEAKTKKEYQVFLLHSN